MKNYFLKSFLGLIMLATALSCSKDDAPASNPCVPITCLNGGTSTEDCSCDCPQGYGGTNCGTQITPSSIKITKIRVTKFPDDDNGDWWDTFPDSDADIYIKLVNSSDVAIYTSPTHFTNATGLGTTYYDFTPVTPVSISNVTSLLGVKLYDYEDVGSDTFMDGVPFFPYTTTGGFPPTITKTSPSGAFECVITLQYTW